MKRHLTLLSVAVAALVIGIAPPAFAQATPDEAAAAARDNGYYIEAGLDADPARISEAVVAAAGEGYRFFVILLDDNPPGGAPTFAGAVLDRLGSGTVLVLSASQEGMESTDFSTADLERAMDEAFDRGSGDAGYVDVVVEELFGVAPSAVQGSSDGGGSRTGLFIMLGIIVLLVLLVWWAIRRQKRASAESEERMVEEARGEIKSQLDAMANTILEISDRVSATETKEDNQYLEQAGATYATALEEFEQALDLRALEAMSDRLEEARWQLDAAVALAYGKEIPPRPEKEIRHQCFFDPNHAEATEIADITTSAGTKKVRVCQEDADKLRRGQQPEPRMIRVAGRNVPAPMAPRSYGGGGMDWLGLFSVIVGGMGQQRSYDWSNTGGGGGLFGSRSRSTSPSAAPRPSTGTRSRAGRSRRRRR